MPFKEATTTRRAFTDITNRADGGAPPAKQPRRDSLAAAPAAAHQRRRSPRLRTDEYSTSALQNAASRLVAKHEAAMARNRHDANQALSAMLARRASLAGLRAQYGDEDAPPTQEVAETSAPAVADIESDARIIVPLPQVEALPVAELSVEAAVGSNKAALHSPEVGQGMRGGSISAQVRTEGPWRCSGGFADGPATPVAPSSPVSGAPRPGDQPSGDTSASQELSKVKAMADDAAATSPNGPSFQDKVVELDAGLRQVWEQYSDIREQLLAARLPPPSPVESDGS